MSECKHVDMPTNELTNGANDNGARTDSVFARTRMSLRSTTHRRRKLPRKDRSSSQPFFLRFIAEADAAEAVLVEVAEAPSLLAIRRRCMELALAASDCVRFNKFPLRNEVNDRPQLIDASKRGS